MSYSCKFSILAMWDDPNDIRTIRQLKYSLRLNVSPVGIEFFDNILTSHRLFVKKVGYNIVTDSFEILLDHFLCLDEMEFNRLFQLWEKVDDSE